MLLWKILQNLQASFTQIFLVKMPTVNIKEDSDIDVFKLRVESFIEEL